MKKKYYKIIIYLHGNSHTISALSEKEKNKWLYNYFTCGDENRWAYDCYKKSGTQETFEKYIKRSIQKDKTNRVQLFRIRSGKYIIVEDDD